MKRTVEEMLEEIALDDLQEQHRELAECVGLESFRKLVRSFGGTAPSIPQAKEVVKLRVYRLIREEYNGANVRALAAKYGVSESTVYNVIREQLRDRARERRRPSIPGQLSIADWLRSE